MTPNVLLVPAAWLAIMISLLLGFGGISFSGDFYCWIRTFVFLLFIVVKFTLKQRYTLQEINIIKLLFKTVHFYSCQPPLPLRHYSTSTQKNMILSYAAVYGGLWILSNAEFLRQAPHRAFCFAFFLSARGITISTINLCLLISLQTQAPEAHTRLLWPPTCLYSGNVSYTRQTSFIYAVNILI